jgi:hypothetical protein
MHSTEHIIVPGEKLHIIEHIIEPTKLLLAWQSMSDGFSIIHPFNNVDGLCELLLEAAGYRHQKGLKNLPQINSPATFVKELYGPDKEDAIAIKVEDSCIGYVIRGLIPTFLNWMKNGRIMGAWVEKTNGTRHNLTVCLYVKVSAK